MRKHKSIEGGILEGAPCVWSQQISLLTLIRQPIKYQTQTKQNDYAFDSKEYVPKIWKSLFPDAQT